MRQETNKTDQIKFQKLLKKQKLYEEDENYTDLDVNFELKNLEKTIVRTDILKNKNRIDGRGLSDVRPISCELVFCQEHMALLCLQEAKHKQS